MKPCKYCGALGHEATAPSVTCINYLKDRNIALLAFTRAVAGTGSEARKLNHPASVIEDMATLAKLVMETNSITEPR